MQAIALRRLQANFCFFKKYTRKFSENLNSKIEKKPFESILYKQHNNFATEIILNEPKKLNSLDTKMIKNMLRKVRQWLPESKESVLTDEDASDSEVVNVPKMVIMSGVGKAFCAGGDIATLYNTKMQGGNEKIIKDFFRYEYLLDYFLTRMKPVQVVMWNGYVMGGGVGISIHAPIRIATDNSLFAMPETAIGLFPDVGGTYFLPRIFAGDEQIGLYMALTGERIKGKDLAKCGLATHYVPLDKFENLKTVLINKANDQSNLQSITNIINEHSDVIYNPAEFEFPKMEVIRRTFKFEEGTIKDLQLIFERLESLSKNGNESEVAWANNTLKTLKNSSPISLAVTYEQIRRGITIKTLEDAFNLEAQMIAAFVEEKESDFFEGVRAKLIEKDNKPNWRYKSINEIDENKLFSMYFDRKEQLNVDPNNTEEKK